MNWGVAERGREMESEHSLLSKGFARDLIMNRNALTYVSASGPACGTGRRPMQRVATRLDYGAPKPVSEGRYMVVGLR